MSKVIRHAEKKDITQILDVIDQAFTDAFGSLNEKRGEDHRRMFGYLYQAFGYDLKDIMVAEVDGKVVSLASAFRFDVKKDGMNISAANISPVATLTEYRGQALAADCIWALCDYLQEEEVALLNLLGHPNYYPRFGFEQVFFSYKGQVSVQNLLEIQTELDICQATEETVEEILSIYKNGTFANLLAPNRDRDWLRKKVLSANRNIETTTDYSKVFLASNDGVIGGYMIISNKQDGINVMELYANDYEHGFALMAKLGKIAEAEGMGMVEFADTIPGELKHELIVNLSGKIEYSHSTPFMLKVLSMTVLLQSNQGLLQKRITQSNLCTEKFALLLENHAERVLIEQDGEFRVLIPDRNFDKESQMSNMDEQSFDLRLERWGDSLLKARVSLKALTRLFSGYQEIDDLMRDRLVENCSQETVAILRVLFPKVHFYIPLLNAI